MNEYLLIDFGSTSIKYAVYNVKEEDFLYDGSIPFPEKLELENEYFYQVPLEEITGKLSKILNSIELNSIKGINISTQMHGYILMDENGNKTPYISWRDKRALTRTHSNIHSAASAAADPPLSAINQLGNTTYYDEFVKENPHIIWSQRGTTSKINLPLISFFAHKKMYPLNYATLFTLGSYIAHTLTGKNQTHITDCAATGMYNIDLCQPLEAYGVDLPTARMTIGIVGEFKGIPVYTPIGDHQASFLGCRVSTNQYLLNIGTATQLSTLSYEKSEYYECRPYLDDRILCTISGLIGGHVIREDKANAWQLIENYRKALELLPTKKSLLVTGGAVSYFPQLIDEICQGLGIPYQFEQNNSAINGLKIIAKEIDENGKYTNRYNA